MMFEELTGLARKIEDQIIHWRRDIHRHPELGFQEHRTARLAASALKSMGLQVETGIGKTGLIARLGTGPPAVGLRADMDALEIQETNDVPYASQVPGVMHACGHDAHTAMLLGAAQILSSLPDRPAGEIRFLFQPMEEGWDQEGKGGAVRMIEDGALRDLDAVFALHVDSTLETGRAAVSSGRVMAGVDPYDALILGTSTHSGSPQLGVNPIALLAGVIQTILAIPAQHTDPLQPALISCEAVHSGASSGVIPEQASLHGNIRYYDQAARKAMHRSLEKALDSVRTQGGDYQLTIQEVFPPTRNDPELTDLIRGCLIDLMGEDQVQPMKPSLAGEDFGYMSGKIPGVYYHLGVGRTGDFRPYHNPRFDIDESALAPGAASLAAAAVAFLTDHKV